MAENVKAIKKQKLKKPAHGKVDIVFLSLVLVLLTVGLVMLFSSSYPYSYTYYGNSYFFIVRQAIFAVVGVGLMLGFAHVDYHFWRKLSLPIYGVTLVLLALLLALPPMVQGMDVRRWIVIGPLNFQPSEIAKFAIILLFSHLITSNYKQMSSWKLTAILVGILGVTCFLIICEPHLSGTLLVLSIGVLLMIIGGTKLSHLLVIGGSGIAAVALAIITGIISYGGDRLKYWLDPWSDPLGEGYQVIQSLLAIGSGGIMGKGLGKSRQKYLWLPEPHNDFIFSVVCEELGIIGALIIIGLFCALIWRGLTIAIKSQDKFGSFMAAGLTFQVGIQAILNILVVTNTIPNTGISLPFFSYGGTALVLLLAQMGIVLSVSRDTSMQKL